MRQLSPLTNLMLACLAAVGLVSSLGLPWYASTTTTGAPSDPGQVADAGSDACSRAPARRSPGSDVLASGRGLVPVLAGVVIVLSLGMMVPALRASLRDLLRAVALATPVLVGFLAVRHPARSDVEMRWGLVAALAIAVVMASAAWHGSAARSRRPAPQPLKRLA